MIQFKDNVVRVQGSKQDLISEFMCIVHTFIEKGVVECPEELYSYVLIATATPEELKEMAIEAIDNMDNIGTALALMNLIK